MLKLDPALLHAKDEARSGESADARPEEPTADPPLSTPDTSKPKISKLAGLGLARGVALLYVYLNACIQISRSFFSVGRSLLHADIVP